MIVKKRITKKRNVKQSQMTVGGGFKKKIKNLKNRYETHKQNLLALNAGKQIRIHTGNSNKYNNLRTLAANPEKYEEVKTALVGVAKEKGIKLSLGSKLEAAHWAIKDLLKQRNEKQKATQKDFQYISKKTTNSSNA
jgi:hypothetical protein